MKSSSARFLRLSLSVLTVAGVAACLVPSAPAPTPDAVAIEALDPAAIKAARDAAFHVSTVNWKERLPQRYVYLEHTGDYRESGQAMRELFAIAQAADLQPVGPPFALFYDNPAEVAADRLRMRACLPIDSDARRPRGLQEDLLARALVVYARVRGAYPDVPKSYPALFNFVADHGWKQAGPVREVYLVDPGTTAGPDELECEVQLPWSAF